MNFVWKFMNDFHIFNILNAIFLLLIGYFIARFLSLGISKKAAKQVSAHSAMLISRSLFYIIFILFIASAIQQLGFHIGTLLGAAGILTAAIGFASQTSMSNVISGLFIIGEKPFKIGDTINVNNVQGEVVSIDLLSVKIRTGDNTMIRVPNEALIKSSIVNLSYFPNRRVDLTVNVSSNENIAQIRELFFQLVDANSLCLKKPEPKLKVQGIVDSALELQFSVWASQTNFSEMKNSMLEELQAAFLKNKINLFNSAQVIQFEKPNEPLPIRLYTNAEENNKAVRE